MILIYYGLCGRVRDRVIISVLLSLLALLLSLACEAPTHAGQLLQGLRRAGCVVLGAFCLLAAVKQPLQIFQPALIAKTEVEDQTAALANYTEDALYIWNPMALDLYMTEHYMEHGRLPPPHFLERNLPYGEWITAQPYFDGMLARTGTGNPMRALAERPNTYLIAPRTEPIQTFLQEHYGSSLTLEQVATQDVFAMGEVPVYVVAATK